MKCIFGFFFRNWGMVALILLLTILEKSLSTSRVLEFLFTPAYQAWRCFHL